MKSLNGDGPTLGKEKTLMFWLQTNLLFWKHTRQLGKANVLYTKGADLAIEDELEIQKKVELLRMHQKNIMSLKKTIPRPGDISNLFISPSQIKLAWLYQTEQTYYFSFKRRTSKIDK
jgi:hypothetical protein